MGKYTVFGEFSIRLHAVLAGTLRSLLPREANTANGLCGRL